MLSIRFCMALRSEKKRTLESPSEGEWDLFRTFEAVARHGGLTAAAKALAMSQSTVSRHLARLEERAGSPLVLREQPIRLTDRGASLLAAVEPMVDAVLLARAALDQTPELRGEVTLTTVGEVARWVVAPQLGSFYRAYPHLRLRILASNERASLAAGDADVALRLARPDGAELVARKVSTETYGFYASRSLAPSEDCPWLGLAGSLSKISEQRHAARAFGSRPPRLLVEDVESLGLAVQAALGVAVLPRTFASRLTDVEEVSPVAFGARDLGVIPSRAFWLVVHRSKQRIPKVRALLDWLGGLWKPRG